MSSNGHDSNQKSVSPNRPKHQITRSVTDISAPVRLHRRHRSRQPSREREDKTPIPQTAAPVLQGRVSLEAGRPEGLTPYLTPNPSRRPSVPGASDDSNGVPPGSLSQQVTRLSREEEVALERERSAARATGLKNSLIELGTVSTETTRRLDVAYTSILEKVSMLQGTIIALKELAELSQEMKKTFNRETQELVDEVQSHLDAIGDLDEQQERIEVLQRRIHAGRDRIQVLSDRVDVVRERIEGWERADREWQEQTRKRLKIIWLIMSLIVFLVILLLIIAKYAPESVEGVEEATARLANKSLSVLGNASGAVGGSEGTWEPGTLEGGRLHNILGNRTGDGAAMEDDARLQLFDEL